MSTTEICMLVTMGFAIAVAINYFLKSYKFRKALLAVLEDPSLYGHMHSNWMESTGRKPTCRIREVAHPTEL